MHYQDYARKSWVTVGIILTTHNIYSFIVPTNKHLCFTNVRLTGGFSGTPCIYSVHNTNEFHILIYRPSAFILAMWRDLHQVRLILNNC